MKGYEHIAADTSQYAAGTLERAAALLKCKEAADAGATIEFKNASDGWEAGRWAFTSDATPGRAYRVKPVPKVVEKVRHFVQPIGCAAREVGSRRDAVAYLVYFSGPFRYYTVKETYVDGVLTESKTTEANS